MEKQMAEDLETQEAQKGMFGAGDGAVRPARFGLGHVSEVERKLPEIGRAHV